MENTQTYTEPVGEAWKYNPEYQRASEFLGVNKYDRENADVANKISFIDDWAAKESKSADPNSKLWTIEGLRKKLGFQFIGKNLVNEMYKHIRLDQDRQKVGRTPVVRTQAKGNPIQKVVAQTVQQSVAGMVKQALGDKKLIQGTIQNAMKEAMK